MKYLIIIMMILMIPFTLATSVVVNVESDETIDVWANPNSGTGDTNYFIDGLNYQQVIQDQARSRKSMIGSIYNSFMQWRLQSTGSWAWQVTDFTELEPRFQRLRYVLESWFVPRSQLKEIIDNQQQQINQLFLEVEAMQHTMNEEDVCTGRRQVMQERNLPYITCGNITYYNDGIGLEAIKRK